MPPSVKKQLAKRLQLERFSRSVQDELLELSLDILHNRFVVWVSQFSDDTLEEFHQVVEKRSAKIVEVWFRENIPDIFHWFNEEIERLRLMVVEEQA